MSVTQDWTARVAAAVLLAWATACGGGDDDPGVAAAPLGDAAPALDAAVTDAAVVDCAGDHRESRDDSNDPFSPAKSGQAERTELALSAGGQSFTICGQIDPRQATQQVTDYDAFAFEVTGAEPVALRIE